MSISVIAARAGLDPAHLVLYGTDKAKIFPDALTNPPRQGKLILVSAITPTPAGEGKTTISIGLAQGLRHTGRSSALALRQPSMGPVFGRKGGATGGGKSTVQPAQSINLHFTGDFHAITSAHNLLSSVLDNALFQSSCRMAPDQALWRRVMDVNDRSLRRILTDDGGKHQRSTGFDITAASEIMASLCLAESREDLRTMLNRMVLGFTPDGEPVRASELKVTGALLALLREAMLPNLVQSVEGVPAFIHGGPFANIAHGCNSVLATRMALAHADYAITEAGFAFDLGGEKFFHIKCRRAGLDPAAVVIVATVRALKMHGGAALESLTDSNPAALVAGLENLAAHLDSAALFQKPVVVALNRFTADTDEELGIVKSWCSARGVPCAVADAFGQGGAGCADLAELVASSTATAAPVHQPLYRPEDGVRHAIHTIATNIYGAAGVLFTPHAEEKLRRFERSGLSGLPVCMAKTQNSLSDDSAKPGRPRGFSITVRDLEIAAGAGFVIALTGTLVRMPALPKSPAAERIDVDAAGNITGI